MEMRNIIYRTGLILAIAIAGYAGVAAAANVEVSFSLKEKQVIASFFGDGGGGGGKAAKGKNKKGGGSQGLPPGLARKGGALPPGIAKKQLPGSLVSRLPAPPQGYERVIVDNDVLLVEIATQIVHDVLTDVVR